MSYVNFFDEKVFRLFNLLFYLIITSAFAEEPAFFKEFTIANDFNSGYQVVAHDIDYDGKKDLIALDSRMGELVWFKNPKWERHVLADGLSRMINLTVCGDFRVVAQRFSNRVDESVGEVVVIMRDGSKRVIDRLSTSHRLRCANIDNLGDEVVINAPLIGVRAKQPDFRDHVPLVYYRLGEWKRHLISEENEGVMHGIYLHDWNSDGYDDILTASFSGVHVYSKQEEWQRTEITKGYPGEWPKVGSSDIAVGNADGRFIASIEPFHGHQVVVYKNGKRLVIDDTLVQGHTIATADLNADEKDEIIAGYRGDGQSVYIYYSENGSWKRTILDNGDMAAASCIVVDLNSDTRLDIACIGRATHNLKWYENQAR